MLAVAVHSVLQKPSTSPSSTCIDLLRGYSCMLYWAVSCMLFFSSSISYMLTAACCGCVSSSKSQSLLCRSSRSVPQRSNTLILSCTLHANPSESCHDRTHFASSEGFATDCILYLTFLCRLKLCALWSLELSYIVLIVL